MKGAQTAANQQQEMVQTYCVTCHSTRAKMGGLALEGLNLAGRGGQR